MTRFLGCIGRDDNAQVDDVMGWYWIASDVQTWPIISRDWEISHKEKILPLVKEKGVVIQAGGNCGMYPRLLSHYFDRVYTAEPDPLNFFCLSANCDDDRIVKLNAAFGEKNQLVRINQRTTANVGMHMVELGEGSYIPTLLIDQLAVDRCDLLWLDVEEYELSALKGAVETIKKFKPVIVLENYLPSHQELLNQYNYKVAGTSGMDTILTSDD